MVGLTSSVGVGAPPFTKGPYTWDQDLTMDSDLTVTGDLTVDGNFSFGNASTDNLSVTGYQTNTYAGSAKDALAITVTANDASYSGIKIATGASGQLTSGMTISGSGTVANGITISQNTTTGITISGTSTNGVSVTGTASNYGYAVASPTLGGFYCSGTTADAVNIVADCTDAGVAITGTCTDGILVVARSGKTITTGIGIGGGAGTTTTGINIGACSTAITSSAGAVSLTELASSAGDGSNVTGLYNTLTVDHAETNSCVGMRCYAQTDGTARAMGNLWAGRFLTGVKAGDTISGELGCIYGFVQTGANTTVGQWANIVHLTYYDSGAARATAPHCFEAFEDYGYGGSYPVSYVWDLGYISNRFPSGTTKAYYEHTLKNKVNGTDKYMVLSDAENSLSLSGTVGATAISVTGSATTALNIGTGTYTTGIAIAGTTTTGISISGTGITTGIHVTGTGATATSKAITTTGYILNNANLTDGYGVVEVELNLTGTTAGESAALSSWVNFPSAAGAHAQRICAQSNGIWATTSANLANSTIIFGMRADCLCEAATVTSAEFYPFSIVNNTNITTALIQCNDASSDLGRISDAGSDSGTLVPLYKDNTGVKYVKIYTHS